MSRYDDRVRELICREAADWFLANRIELRSKELERFSAWLKTSPVHIEEYLAVAALTDDLREACADSEQAIEAVIARARSESEDAVEPLWPRAAAPVRRTAFVGLQTSLAVATSLAVLGLVVLAFWGFRPVSRLVAQSDGAMQHFRTRHGEQETRRLTDNSVLQLNTDSAATVHYDPRQRLVLLDSGEAVFDVTREADRPFLVRAGSTEIRVLGTRFDVRREADSTVITVLEGRVAVGPSAVTNVRGSSGAGEARDPFLQLSAGQQARFIAGEPVGTTRQVDGQRTTAWLHRQIMFEHETLEIVANEFNRYTRSPIEITAPELRHLEVSGVFATDDTEAFIAFLRSLKGVRVEVTPTHTRVSQD